MRSGLVLTNLFPNPVEPARGIFVLQETLRLREFYDLKVMAPLPWVPRSLRENRRYAYHAAPMVEQCEGLEIHHPRHLVIPRYFRFLYGPLLFLGLLPLARRMAKERKPDFILAHYVFPDGYAAVKLGRMLGIPVIVKARGSDINLFTRTWMRRRMTLWTLRNSKCIVAVSRALKEKMISLGIDGERIEVVHNGLDTTRFHPSDRLACRARLGLEERPFTFLFIGYLRSLKGIFTMLQAFRAIPEMERRGARMIMIGEGELQDEAAVRIRRFGMSNQVRLVPPIKHDEVPEWIGACDCLLLPSMMEGYPNVLIEAMACGRPVIASRVGGIPEIVRDGRTGRLIEPNDPWALTDAMLEMMKGFEFDSTAAEAAGRGWDAVAAEMSELIQRVLTVAEAS